MQEHIEKGSFQQRRELDCFACGGGASEHEYAASYNRAHAKGGEAKPAKGFLQPSVGQIGVGDELIDTLRTEKLWVQSPPSASDQRETLPCAPVPCNRGLIAQASCRLA
jgi:hypothetical protein